MKDDKGYTWKEIRDTNDPEILVEVLDKFMAEDPEDMGKVFKREKSGKTLFNWALIKDHRLAKIINDGMWAAYNPNCPSEVLVEVLKRGNDDEVSRYAASNQNCPPKARLEWYEATGQLTKYDPEKFELEHNEEDKDLDELRKLMD